MKPFRFLSRLVPMALSVGIESNSPISIWIIVCSLLQELCTQIREDKLEERLKKIENELKRLEIDTSKLTDILDNISEHKYYVLRYSIKYSLRDALPENVDLYNKSLVSMITKEKYEYEEMACEIISQLNANDIMTLEIIQSFIERGEKTAYLKYLSEETNGFKPQKGNTCSEHLKTNYKDRNIVFDNNKTIFWEDFTRFFKSPGRLLELSCQNFVCDIVDGDKCTHIHVDEFNFVALSIQKLSRVGVLALDFNTTLGTSSFLNVNRMHITLIGQKLLSYVSAYEGTIDEIILKSYQNQEL